jgi:hypothetical protein
VVSNSKESSKGFTLTWIPGRKTDEVANQEEFISVQTPGLPGSWTADGSEQEQQRLGHAERYYRSLNLCWELVTHILPSMAVNPREESLDQSVTQNHCVVKYVTWEVMPVILATWEAEIGKTVVQGKGTECGGGGGGCETFNKWSHKVMHSSHPS